MNFKERMTVGRIVAFCICCLLPFALIVFGLIGIFGSIIVNFSYVLCMLLLPLACMSGLFFLIFSKASAGFKIIVAVIILIAFVWLFCQLFIFLGYESLRSYEGSELSEPYTKHVQEFAPMPELSQVGNAECMAYYDYFSVECLIFTCDADYLICRYTDSEYQTRKGLLDEQYVFQKEKLSACGYCVEPEVMIDGYVFRLVADHDYPKKLMFVATNDDTDEIIYMSFYDDDLDYIESLDEFILKDCGWQRVRKANARAK